MVAVASFTLRYLWVILPLTMTGGAINVALHAQSDYNMHGWVAGEQIGIHNVFPIASMPVDGLISYFVQDLRT